MREPLFQFFVLGAAIYLVSALIGAGGGGDTERTIRVTAADIATLEASWQKRWYRLPTPRERQGLIQDYVRERVLYREALAMGLDEDDVIVRRRLAQKLEFLFQDLAALREATDDEILEYFEDNKDLYKAPDLISMIQVFVDPDRRDENTLPDAEKIKAQLKASGDPTTAAEKFGDPLMLQSYYRQRTQQEIAKLFGAEFSESVFELSTGEWHGPVFSGYGVHLVYIHSFEISPVPSLESVHSRVLQDWEDEKRRELNQSLLDELISRYDVIVEDEMPTEEAAASGNELP